MSSFVYPVLPGLTYDVIRTPMWHTERQTSLSGKRSTLAYAQYPLIHFELTYSILRDDISTSDIKALVGLFNALQGGYDTFLFTDPDFNQIFASTPMQFAIGNGTAGPFQVTASYQNSGGPGYGEIIQNFNGTPAIYVNGVAQVLTTAYTIGPTGIVTFAAGHFPAAAAVIAWSGQFYYRCAFDEDELKIAKFMNFWWAAKKVPFTSVKL